MSEQIEVPFEGSAEEQAVLLLEAAEKLGKRREVRTTSDGFVVPKDVHDAAFKKSSAKKDEDDKKSPAKKNESKE